MSNPEQFRAETAIGLVKPFHRVECRCKACIAWLQIELCKQWAEVWRLKADYDAKCEAYHEVVTNYGPALDEAKRLRAKTVGLETENQTLLVRIENRDNEIERLQAIVGKLLKCWRLNEEGKRVQDVPVNFGDILWWRTRRGPKRVRVCVWLRDDITDEPIEFDDCSSTQEAAEAAARSRLDSCQEGQFVVQELRG